MFLDGHSIIEGTMSLPRVGAWTAHLVVDASSVPVGRVGIEIDDVAYNGTVVRSGEWAGRVRVLVVGGAGGLAKEIPPRFYRGTPARLPLADVLRTSGESLSERSDQQRMATLLPAWSVKAGPASDALALIARHIDSTWRVQPDGAVWFGTDTWQAQRLEYELTAANPAGGWREFWSERFRLRPGVTLDGVRVGHVEYRISPDKLRTCFWEES